MSFDSKFKRALKRYLVEVEGLEDVNEVTSWEGETRQYGFCDTCAWEEHGILIYFTTEQGESESFFVEARVSDLTRQLEKYWD